MPSLHYHLHQPDLGLLRIFAGHWGIEAPLPDRASAIAALEDHMLDAAQVEAVWARLPDDARAALQALLSRQGRMPWADFVRRFGEFREMGPARRERERPHEHPTSPVEMLWYTGLVGRAFLPTDRGPVEFAYIPDELLPLLPASEEPDTEEAPPGRPATPEESAHPLPLTDHILDHLTTFLAARRARRPCDQAPDRSAWRYTPDHLAALARAAGMLSPDGEVVTDAARAFLTAPRGRALLLLFSAWRDGTFNDLKLMPGVVTEGHWENDPRQARAAILDWLKRVPQKTWWSLEGLIAAVQQCCPDFQRPAPGDYASWYLRDAHSDASLRGWEHWREVDGALIRFIITGPLAWLGVVRLAAPEKGAAPTAFRLTSWGEALLQGRPPAGLHAENRPLQLRSDGLILASWQTPRVVRYHVARFADWEGTTAHGYRFRLSAEALERAASQGIHASQVLRLLESRAEAMPPSIKQALLRWMADGAQATLQPLTVLEVSDPAILTALQESAARRYIVRVLSPTAAAIPPAAAAKVRAALAELGYFAKVKEG